MGHKVGFEVKQANLRIRVLSTALDCLLSNDECLPIAQLISVKQPEM